MRALQCNAVPKLTLEVAGRCLKTSHNHRTRHAAHLLSCPQHDLRAADGLQRPMVIFHACPTRPGRHGDLQPGLQFAEAHAAGGRHVEKIGYYLTPSKPWILVVNKPSA